jgi:hypothetical protein
MQHYGQAESEKLAEEKQACRQILTEINKFGITQRQQLFLIYLLASELEDVEIMQALTSTVRELGGQSVFLSPLEVDSV